MSKEGTALPRSRRVQLGGWGNVGIHGLSYPGAREDECAKTWHILTNLLALAMKTAGRPEHQQRHERCQSESQMQTIKHGGPGSLGQRTAGVCCCVRCRVDGSALPSCLTQFQGRAQGIRRKGRFGSPRGACGKSLTQMRDAHEEGAKQILQEENLLEPKWTVPANRSQVAESTKPIETPQLVETPQPIQASPAAFEIEQPAIEQPEIEKPEINESKPSKSAIKQLADFIQQPEYTDEERILKQTPSLEEFISKSKHTVFDKKDADEEVKPAQSLNDKFGKTAQIGLNDKLAFVQKLFFGSESEYNKVVKHIANLHSMQDAVIYIEQEVKPTYNYWKGKEEYEQRFLDLLLKRFEV